MIDKKEFFGENYEIFKKEAEEIINNYQFGTYYKTDLKECKIKLEDIMSLTQGSPVIYLRFCSLYKFFNDIYKMPYVKKLFDYAKEQGYSVNLPEELLENFDMDKFAISVIRKKARQHLLNMNYYFDLNFFKDNEGNKINSAIPLLDYRDERFYVEDISKISNGIKKMELY